MSMHTNTVDVNFILGFACKIAMFTLFQIRFILRSPFDFDLKPRWFKLNIRLTRSRLNRLKLWRWLSLGRLLDLEKHLRLDEKLWRLLQLNFWLNGRMSSDWNQVW